MPAVIGAFILGMLGHIVGKVLFLLGFTLIAYVGADAGIGFLETWVEGQFGGLPSYMLALMGMLQMDTAIAIIIGAFATRAAVRAASGASQRISLNRSAPLMGG